MVCPHARIEATYGGDAYVNRAPYFGVRGLSIMINSHQDRYYQQAVYDFASFMSSPDVSGRRVKSDFMVRACVCMCVFVCVCACVFCIFKAQSSEAHGSLTFDILVSV